MKYYLGLDNGGTTTKAALYDINGKEMGVSSVSSSVETPKPGFIDRDMEEMWDANCRVIRNLLSKVDVDPSDIAGIGICGHGKGLYLWGKDDRPVRPGIPSADNRAYSYCVKWRDTGVEKEVFNISYQHIMPSQQVSLLAWLKDNEPQSYSKIRWVFAAKDYIRFRMTGEAKAEYTDYSGANLLNLKTKDYDMRLLNLFGIEEIADALPPLCLSTEICGYVTSEAAERSGLKEGTPVIGGMFDIDACALAVGVDDESTLCAIAGTWSINEYIRKSPVLDGSVKMNSLFAVPEYYLVEESSPTSAGNNEWFIPQLLPEVVEKELSDGHDFYDELNRWVEEIHPEEFVPVYLPYIMASNVHPNAKACFVGMSMNHTRKHLLRSVYEGIVFCHKMHIDKLLKSRDQPVKCIRLAGGAAKSRVWTQMFADVLQIPVETVDVNETGTLGCAIAVATAVGDYGSVAEAVNNMCEISPAIKPDKTVEEIYERKYSLFLKTIERLDGLWTDMQDMAEGCT